MGKPGKDTALQNKHKSSGTSLVSFSIMVFFGYMPTSGVVGLYASFIPSFKKKLHTVLHSGYTNLHSHPLSSFFIVYLL